jgi:hypothetical protein
MRSSGFWCVAALSLGQFFAGSLPAQEATNAAAAAPARAARTAASEIIPPLPTAAKPPVEFFRELLAMNVVERNQALTNRMPEDRRLILAKVREYQALKPDQRELRLQATELSWYLLRLMRMPGTNRQAQLEGIPVSSRKLVEDRLDLWDKLTPEVQKEFLQKQATVRYFLELAAGTASPSSSTNISPERHKALTNGIEQIRAMPEAQRQQLLSLFNQFFELGPNEKERVLNTISEPERRQMEKTLRSFGQLTPAQRNRCIRSFEKFAGLSIQERNQFLKNAERWKLMTPEQRQAWREVVSKVPLLPAAPDLPPLPKPAPPRRTSPPVVTNGN